MIELLDLMAISHKVELYPFVGIVDHVMERKVYPIHKNNLNLRGKVLKILIKKNLIKKKDVWNKGLKPLGKDVGKKILNDPVKAFQLASQVGSAVSSRNPQAIMNAGLQAGRFVSGKGVKIADLTNGGSLYLYRK